MGSKIESAVNWMISHALDDSNGYDQAFRWGKFGDWDCSSALIESYEQAGVPVKTFGASYTGNMLPVFKKCGFQEVTDSVNLHTGSGLIRGDVLLNVRNHTALYIGNGQECEAAINEFGGIVGGIPGDQTGQEFAIMNYRNYPWTNVLRYPEAEIDPVSGDLNVKWVGKVVNVEPDTLTVRIGPSIYHPANSKWPALGEGNLIEVCDYVSGWYYIRIIGIHYGWVWSEYVVPAVNDYTESWVGAVYNVYPDTLTVRIGPGDEFDRYKPYSRLNENDRVLVLESVPDKHGNIWYRIKIHPNHIAYVYSEYIKAV